MPSPCAFCSIHRTWHNLLWLPQVYHREHTAPDSSPQDLWRGRLALRTCGQAAWPSAKGLRSSASPSSSLFAIAFPCPSLAGHKPTVLVALSLHVCPFTVLGMCSSQLQFCVSKCLTHIFTSANSMLSNSLLGSPPFVGVLTMPLIHQDWRKHILYLLSFPTYPKICQVGIMRRWATKKKKINLWNGPFGENSKKSTNRILQEGSPKLAGCAQDLSDPQCS